MADTTSLWVFEVLELWRYSGDSAMLQQFYPTAASAVRWQINRARRLGINIPDHLVNTYDMCVVCCSRHEAVCSRCLPVAATPGMHAHRFISSYPAYPAYHVLHPLTSFLP